MSISLLLILSLSIRLTIPIDTDCNDAACTPLSTAEKQAILDLHNELRDRVAGGGMYGEGHPMATDMNYLFWDQGLEAVAQSYAESCPGLNHNPDRNFQIKYQRDATPQNTKWDTKNGKTMTKSWCLSPTWNPDVNETCIAIGENIAVNTEIYDLNVALSHIETGWWNEYTIWTYGPSSFGCNPNGEHDMCGHYTQMAWANTRYIGCGYSNGCTSGGWPSIFVCNYFPVGNMNGGSTPPYTSGDNTDQCTNCMSDRTECKSLYVSRSVSAASYPDQPYNALCDGGACATMCAGDSWSAATCNECTPTPLNIDCNDGTIAIDDGRDICSWTYAPTSPTQTPITGIPTAPTQIPTPSPIGACGVVLANMNYSPFDGDWLESGMLDGKPYYTRNGYYLDWVLDFTRWAISDELGDTMMYRYCLKADLMSCTTGSWYYWSDAWLLDPDATVSECVIPTDAPSELTDMPTPAPTNVPTDDPTPAPTEQPTRFPTEYPTPAPTSNPTKDPTPAPTLDPTPSPTLDPTPAPTLDPTSDPTPSPTSDPSPFPTLDPTPSPTSNPSSSPTKTITTPPTENPTPAPTKQPTSFPTEYPTPAPTENPTNHPSSIPSKFPTRNPSKYPTAPTQTPTSSTSDPTLFPTSNPSSTPTTNPTPSPTQKPTPSPTADPTSAPTTVSPTLHPTPSPTSVPTPSPTSDPTPAPTSDPTPSPTTDPTSSPTTPTTAPTKNPTPAPNTNPSRSPTLNPTLLPTHMPHPAPTDLPTPSPTSNPTPSPTAIPTTTPTEQPIHSPTQPPTLVPTRNPSETPTPAPTQNPTLNPSSLPTSNPSSSPTLNPSSPPTSNPSLFPTSSSPTLTPTRNPTKNPTTAAPTRNGQLVCGDRDTGSYDDAALTFWVRMPFDDGDLTFDATNTLFSLTSLTLGDSNVQTLKTVTDGTKTLTYSNTPKGDYVFTMTATAGTTGTYDIGILCHSNNPTSSPSKDPSISPTNNPTPSPTSVPTPSPTSNPTPSPTSDPSPSPTSNPTPIPTESQATTPSTDKTSSPTKNTTPSPTADATLTPTTVSPTLHPTPSPTSVPTSVQLNLHFVCKYMDKPSTYYSFVALSKYADLMVDSVFQSLKITTEHSAQYQDADIWESMSWSRAGIIYFNICSIFNDIELNGNCPSYHSFSDSDDEDIFIAIGTFGVVVDQSLDIYKEHLRDEMSSDDFYEVFGEKMNEGLNAERNGNRRRNLLDETDNFEVVSIQIIESFDIVNVESDDSQTIGSRNNAKTTTIIFIIVTASVLGFILIVAIFIYYKKWKKRSKIKYAMTKQVEIQGVVAMKQDEEEEEEGLGNVNVKTGVEDRMMNELRAKLKKPVPIKSASFDVEDIEEDEGVALPMTTGDNDKEEEDGLAMPMTTAKFVE